VTTVIFNNEVCTTFTAMSSRTLLSDNVSLTVKRCFHTPASLSNSSSLYKRLHYLTCQAGQFKYDTRETETISNNGSLCCLLRKLQQSLPVRIGFN
jgi:hypothetical protein